MAAWGFQFKIFFPKEKRLETAANVLIISNIIMIFLNIITINISIHIGLLASILSLIISLSLIFKLDFFSEKKIHIKTNTINSNNKHEIIKPFIFLCLFILIISINSGLMYRVVNPTFSNYKFLTSYYWAMPYILALLTVRNILDEFNKTHILYIGLSMIGFSYIVFMWLNSSVISYLIINTLMLGAFGIYDLFF